MKSSIKNGLYALIGIAILVSSYYIVQGSKFGTENLNLICSYDECWPEGYYVINSDNLNYLQGCKSNNLPDPHNKCILYIVGSHIYISPGSTDSVLPMPLSETGICDKGQLGTACGYCPTLITGGRTWSLPSYELGGLIDIYNHRSKLSSLYPEWYWSSTFYGFDGRDTRWFMRDMNLGDNTRNWMSEKARVRCISTR